NPSTANNLFFWEASFECINRLNIVNEGIQGAIAAGVLSPQKGNAYRGELLFLRALTLHSLLTHFALPYNVTGNHQYGLPLYLTPFRQPASIEEGLKTGRSTVEETYAQALEDLNEAEILFEDNNKNPANGITRASKGAVIALKSRVYLHKRDWSNVKKEAAKLLNGTTAPFSSPIGGYQLTPSPQTPFLSYDNNTESIFSIENNADDNAGYNGAMSAMMSAREGGRAIVTSSPILYNSPYWRGDDKRRDLLLYRESDQYYFCDKYRNPLTNEEYTPIIRYAEVLLNYAEAALRSGEISPALEMLNAVRNRSLPNPDAQGYKASDFATEKELLEAILWERRIEFHGEGRRWEDIHRLAADDQTPSGGIPAKIEYANARGQGAFAVNGEVKEEWFATNKPFIPYTDKRFLWPIPVNDLVRNPTLAGQQNEGW
ncbi:MAG: RagB/SusD family nutrient uptake outer membrane protein, partial [Tannerellaceae bacterium]|nr:RagB/SusD family nutrient uptake outer membrane protein [Tannerellaceae bacterium]